MWKFKRKGNHKGFSLIEIIAVMSIISVLVAIAIPTLLQQRHKNTDGTMKADLIKVANGMETAIHSWRDVPPADVPIVFSSSTWSIIYSSNTIVSGTASPGNTISGTIWQDGSYCAQVANPNGSNNWQLRSDTGKVSVGSCPSTAIGGIGSLGNASGVTLPSSPGNLSVVNTSNVDNSIDVSWATVTGATSYIVSVTGLSPITITAPGVSTTVTNIAGGDTTVSVRAVNAAGSGLASTTSLTVNGGNLFPTGVTTPLSAAAGSATLERVQIGTTGLGLGGSSLTSDTSTIKFGTNAVLATASWIAGRSDGGLNFYTQTAGGSILNNLSLTTVANTFNTDVKILSSTAATSTTTGALNITGGVGVQGAMYIGGNIVISGTCTGTGCNNSNASITNDTSTNATYYPNFITATSGSFGNIKTSSTKLTFNPSTGVLSAILGGGTGLPISTGVTGLGTGIATFLATPSSTNLASTVTGITGTGAVVFGTSPVLTTPDLGTPSSLILTNATSLPLSGLSNLGTGVAAFLATPSSANLATAVTGATGTSSVVFSTSPVLVTPNLGTPTALTLTNATGLPIATGISGLGTGIATFLATASSTNLSTVITDGTGTGNLVLNTSGSFTDPKIHIGINNQVGTTYTFVLTDDSKLVVATNASSQTYSIPTNASVAFPIGTQIILIQTGAGLVTVNAVTPATTTILSSGGVSTAPVLRAQYSAVTLVKIGTDTWSVGGDLT